MQGHSAVPAERFHGIAHAPSQTPRLRETSIADPEPSRVTLVRRLALLLAALLVAACSAPSTPLRVATNVWPGYEFLYLAREKGLYDDRIRLVELASASDVMDALRTGDIEAGALTLDETITLASEGVDLVVVLVFDISAGADVLMTRPSIKRLEDLRGQRIAVETTALGAVMLEGALAKARLPLDAVQVRHLSLREHLEAYQRGEIDAAITFPPYDSALAAAGAVRRFDSGSIPGRIVDVLAVRRDAIDGHHQGLRALVHGYFAAREAWQEAPAEALAIINHRLKLPADELPGAFDGLHLPSAHEMRTMLTGEPAPLEASARALGALMHQNKLLPEAPMLPALANDDFLPEDP